MLVFSVNNFVKSTLWIQSPSSGSSSSDRECDDITVILQKRGEVTWITIHPGTGTHEEEEKRNSHGMLTVAWRDWEKSTKLQSGRFEPSTSQTRQVLKVEWTYSVQLLQYETFYFQEQKVHWNQSVLTLCSKFSTVSEIIFSYILPQKWNCQFDQWQTKSKICKNNFFTHCSSTLHTHIFNKIENMAKNTYQVLIPFWDMTSHNRIMQ